MIIRFTVSNFLSFKEETEFNMLTGDIKRHPHHVYKHPNVDVLRAAAIYGANGAGKSNLIKAIDFLKRLVLGENVLSSYQKFKLSKEFSNKPSELGIEFDINGVVYAYGIVFNYERVLEEWLYKVTFDKEDELIFTRHTDENKVSKLNFNEKYLQTEKDRYFVEFYEKELLTANITFISTTKNEHFEEILSIKRWFKENITLITPTSRPLGYYKKVFEMEELKTSFNTMIPQFSTGLKKIDFIKKEINEENAIKTLGNVKFDFLKKNPKHCFIPSLKKNIYIYTCENEKIYQNELVGFHNSTDGFIQFHLDEESDGTIRLLDFISLIFDIRDKDGLIIIDEIDRSIHPSLTKVFLSKLMEIPKTKGQIIFTTHESNLLDLDIFRQDEIWFAEKNNEGATQLYPLSDFKTRADLDIRKGYLNGRFGAIPFLGNLEQFNWNQHEKAESSL